MPAITVQRFCFKIRNSWVRDGLSEILCTFILALFVYASGAQYVLSDAEDRSPIGRAFAGAAGLMIAVFATIGTSGGSANPNVSLMFCLLGKMQWRKLPLYVICEMIGAFLAAALTYFIYMDLFNVYDGGLRAVFGQNATAHLFTSFPHHSITWTTGFFDVVIATGLLTFSIAAITDPKNAGTPKYLIPFALVPMLVGIVSTFGLNTGAAINIALDVSGRLFGAIVYGADVFRIEEGYSWAVIPPLGGIVGASLGSLFYQIMAGNHLQDQDASDEQCSEGSDLSRRVDRVARNFSHSQLSHSTDSIKTLTTTIESF